MRQHSRYRPIPRPLPPRAHAPSRPWWRLLMNRWAICGLFIFVGLAMSAIEEATRWVEQQFTHASSAQPPVRPPELSSTTTQDGH